MKYNRQTPCVYHNIKVVFHGIPKNASTTIKNALYHLDTGEQFDNDNKQWIHKGNEKGGSEYPPIEEISTKYRPYKHLAVVRHPYERFISFYTDLVQRTAAHRFETPPFYTDNNLDITKFSVDQCIDMLDTYNDDQGDEHFISQSLFIHNDVLFYMQMNDLNNGWNSFCEFFSLSEVPLQHYNNSKGSIELTQDQKDRLFNRYKTDFERFGYDR